MKNSRKFKETTLSAPRKQDGGDVSQDEHHDDNRINAFDPDVARAIGSLPRKSM